MTWPIHENDPVHYRRRLRRALLVAGEHIRREVEKVLLPVVNWLSRKLP